MTVVDGTVVTRGMTGSLGVPLKPEAKTFIISLEANSRTFLSLFYQIRPASGKTLNDVFKVTTFEIVLLLADELATQIVVSLAITSRYFCIKCIIIIMVFKFVSFVWWKLTLYVIYIYLTDSKRSHSHNWRLDRRSFNIVQHWR